MPTERMDEVEVVCPICNGTGDVIWHAGGQDSIDPCGVCDRSGTLKAPTKARSLTAARLRLADAAEAREACEEMPGDTEEEIATAVQTWDVADDEYRAAYKAIAALRTARGA